MRIAVIIALLTFFASSLRADWTFVRGDANGDGGIDVSDAIFTLDYLFQPGPSACLLAMDMNDDGALDVADVVFGLNAMFVGDAVIATPFPGCGIDPTPDVLDCLGPVASCSEANDFGPLFMEMAHPSDGASDGAAVGDLNGDGILDIVGLNRSDGTVAILLGQGDGLFASAVMDSLGIWGNSTLPDRPTLVDLDGDGDLDLLGGTVSGLAVLSGNGDGTFAAPISYAVSFGFSAIEIADLDQDGTLDVFLPSHFNSAGMVLMGNGAGGYTSSTVSLVDSFAGEALADFDNDGITDLVISDFDGFLEFWSGDGDGTFTFGNNTAPPNLRSLIAGDIDGDGNVDVVAERFDIGIVVFMGDGDGTFTLGQQLGFPDFATPQQLRDVDADGALDLIVRRPTVISVLLGNGDGTFGATIELVRPNGVGGFDLADLDGDGLLDLAECYFGAVYTIRGAGDGSFPTGPHSVTPVGGDPVASELADLDADGHLDLVVVDANFNALRVFVGDSDGSLQSIGAFFIEPGANSLASGDLDGDGFLDLAVANDTGTVTLLFGIGDGTVSAPTELTIGDGPRTVAITDLDEDGNSDILTVNYQADEIGILMGIGGGAFEGPFGIPAGSSPRAFTTGDIDGDGVIDIVTTDYSTGSLGVLLGMGDGTFDSIALTPLGGGAGVSRVDLGDLNGDGYRDAVVGNIVTDVLTVLLGDGTGSFVVGDTYSLVEHPLEMVLADLDADGALDIVTLVDDAAYGLVEFRRGNGDGTFEAAQHLPGFFVITMSVGDVDGDGDRDVITVRPSQTLRILENVTAP